MPKFLTALLAVLALVPCAQAETAAPQLDIAQTVVKVPLAEGVSMDDAVDSMKLRANAINMKLVAEQPLYKEIEAMGQKSQRIQIFQFCNPLTAKEMVDYDINFVGGVKTALFGGEGLFFAHLTGPDVEGDAEQHRVVFRRIAVHRYQRFIPIRLSLRHAMLQRVLPGPYPVSDPLRHSSVEKSVANDLWSVS